MLSSAVLLLAFLLPLTAFAQNSSDGSLYSRFGLGEIQSFSSAQGEALGHSGIALHSFNYLNISNPGTWADQVLTRASAGFTYQNLRISDASNATSRLASGFLNGVQFGFPILEQELGVAIGFVPYSRVGYRVVNEGILTPDTPARDSVGYVVDFTGSGGLQQVVGGMGYRFNRNFSVGASLNAIFGIIENGRRTYFIGSGTTSGFIPTNVSSSTRLNGFTATFGTYINARRLFGDDDFIGVGATFTLPTTLSGERVRTLGEQLDRDTLGTVVGGDVDIPWRLGLGVSYHPDARWTVSTGGEYAPWTDFRSSLPFPGYDPEATSNLADRWQIGTGIEFVPGGSDLLASYFARVGYRLGVSYEQSYIGPAGSDAIRTLAGTVGFSLPTVQSGTRLDVNMQVGRRGKTEGALVQDVFYRLAVSVNIGERWFQTPRLR